MSSRDTIESAWEGRASLTPSNAPKALRDDIYIQDAIGRAETLLTSARAHAFDVVGDLWASLLDGRQPTDRQLALFTTLYPRGATRYYDKVASKFGPSFDFAAAGFRVVPPAMARRGAYIAKNAVLMPSYVNIGAYVDEGTMVDTWATVGSCAQIGKNVHLSGGVGIGGVLEPIQANPVIVEDNCFIGARSEVVEGVIVEENSVLSMGVYLGQSTRILDRTTGQVIYGRVLAGSVVVAGTLPSPDGKYALYSAVIVKKVDAKTRAKTSLNELLRGD